MYNIKKKCTDMFGHKSSLTSEILILKTMHGNIVIYFGGKK